MKILQRFNASTLHKCVKFILLSLSTKLFLLPLKAQDPCTLFLGILSEDKIDRVNCIHPQSITVIGTPYSITLLSQYFQFTGINKIEHCITINGTLIIDKPYAFTDCHFTMNKGSQIVIGDATSTHNVQFNYCTFQGNTTMWKGIKVSRNDTITLRNSKIMDAEVALDIYEETDYRVFRNHFASNWVSIRCLGTPGMSNNHVNRVLHANLYDRLVDGFLPEYDEPNIQPNTVDFTETPYAAILFDKEPMLQPTIDCEPSFVRDHANGIIATDDHVLVEAFFFENISDENGYNSPINGYGIYGNIFDPTTFPGVGRKHFRALGFGTNQSVYFTPDDYPLESIFDNVQYPIYAENFTQDVNIYYNRITNILGKGIEITGSESIHIQDNRLSNYYRYGILLKKNSPLGEPNTIYKNYLADGPLSKFVISKGIRIENDSYKDIFENYFDLSYGREGICFYKTTHSHIDLNTIENTKKNSDVYAGIVVEAKSEDNVISRNLITLNELTGFSTGIVVSDAKSNTFECNHINNFSYGMYFEYNCNPTFIQNNIFYDAVTAIELFLGTHSIGPQVYGDNKFVGNYTNDVVRYAGTNVSTSQFTQRPSDQNTPTDFWPSSFSPPNLFITGSEVAPSETICKELSDYDMYKINPIIRNELSHHKEMKTDFEVEFSESRLNIFPNPSYGVINIHFDRVGSKYSIFNTHGKRVKIITARNKHQKLDISGLKAGLYILTNGISNSKFIVL